MLEAPDEEPSLLELAEAMRVANTDDGLQEQLRTLREFDEQIIAGGGSIYFELDQTPCPLCGIRRAACPGH